MFWYLKGFKDAETTERQPVSLEQTMEDAETHFQFVWDEYKRDLPTQLQAAVSSANVGDAFISIEHEDDGFAVEIHPYNMTYNATGDTLKEALIRLANGCADDWEREQAHKESS